METGNKTVLLVFVYRKPGPLGQFLQDLFDVLLELGRVQNIGCG